MEETRRWLTINRAEQWQECFLRGLALQEDCVVLPANGGIASGCMYLPALDGAERDFAWGRLSILADLPADTVLLVRHYVSNVRTLSVEEPDIDDCIRDPMLTPSKKAALLDTLFREPAVRNKTELLIGEKGRYLWLKLELMASGEQSPAVERIRLELSGDHMLTYMPALYRREDRTGFLYRYLSIFNTLTVGLEEEIDHVAERFDYERAQGALLRYLAGWVCVEDTGQEDDALRREIGEAAQSYRLLYTPEAIREQVRRWTGERPLLIEHFQIRECLKRGAQRELYLRLYGDNPYRFFLLVREDALQSRQEAELLLARIRQAIPAHVEAELILLKQNVYLDFHTYLGLNSVIGGYAHAAVDEKVALQYDTIIGGIPS